MKLTQANVRGFRRLENVSIEFEESETVFVGPNNSGKTSATDVFRTFLKSGEFSIHDFSVSHIPKFDKFGRDEIDETALPNIELDLWFSIDPETEFGRAGLLLPDTEQEYDKVGIRLRYMVDDAKQLKENFKARLSPKAGGAPKKSLSHYLSLSGTLKQHFSLSYYKLDKTSGREVETTLSPEQGRHALRSLVRVEFIDAQRKIDDSEQFGSTRLSKLFAGYYKRHLDQAQPADEAHDLIDKHNDELTVHYATVFADLLDVIKGLGVPSVNDRTLRIISSLIPESVLRSNTTLTYFDADRSHELPERYNGLGVKNLIYLAIQICEYHLDWMKTEENRPLAFVLFIEEPECHLHAQAQQAFITNAWEIIEKASKRCGEEGKAPQLVVTTHSSHILDTVDFASVRYFRRIPCAEDDHAKATTLNASKVLNLRNFNPSQPPASDKDVNDNGQAAAATGNAGDEVSEATAQETLDFLKRYLKLTHCDLFFADAAVLVEGTVEKLLLPKMIESVAEGLRQRYLTVLEVSGAYAHRFATLIEFISIPYLVITDIDSVDPTKKRSACRADKPGAVSSNAALNFFLKASSIKDLVALDVNAQHVPNRRCYVAYQRPSTVDGYPGKSMHGRTFEEAFGYENLPLFRLGALSIGEPWTVKQDHEAEYTAIYETVKSREFKKTEFALSVISAKANWVTPQYIHDGLKWLEGELRTTTPNANEEIIA